MVRLHRVQCPDFNPRSPWGERPVQQLQMLNNDVFQSTLPVGGATNLFGFLNLTLVISIHAPRGGSDIYMKHWTTFW